MSIFDFSGPFSERKFYLRDFRNAYKFRPDVNPTRQKFQGYVNFIFNRDLFNFLFDGNVEAGAGTLELRTTLSSLIRTADLPSVQFKTDTKNQYNRKKITHTGIEYQPVNMTVFDTVGNEWLTTLMRYFTYHYMDPRNKHGNGDGNRDIDEDHLDYITGSSGYETAGSKFGGDTFDSNRAGFNPNATSKFFERIDYVMYHGNKGVQYSILNPVMTSFKPGTIDYASSDPLEFNMTFDYESFTTYNKYNFQLSGEDLDRFETVEMRENDPVFGAGQKAQTLGEREQTSLGTVETKNNRSPQPDVIASGGDEGDTETVPAPNSAVGLSPTYGTGIENFTTTGASAGPFSDLLTDIIDSGISAAIHDLDIEDAVVGTAVRGTTRIIGQAIEDVFGDDSL